MTKKLLWSLCALCFAFTAYADAPRDPHADEPVELYVDRSVTTNIDVNIDINQVSPAYTPNNMGPYQPNVNYFFDNGAPIPRFGTLVPVIINANVRLSSRQLTSMTDLMQNIQYELNKQGYNTNLAYYGVQSLRIGAATFTPGSYVALANQQYVVASAQVPNFPTNMILFNAVGNMNLLSWPLNVLFQGQIDLQHITVFLAPVVNTNPGWGGNLPPPHFPHQNYIQLGATKIYDKRPISGNSQTAVFRNLDSRRAFIVYPNYRQIVIDVTGNTLTTTKVRVEYVDRYGYIDGINLSTRRHSVRDGDTLTFDIPHGVSIRSVTVDGYSPNIKGSRARVTVGLR